MHAASWSVGYRGILSDAWLDSAVWADRAALWRERFAAAAPERYLAVAHEDGSVVGFVCAQRDADPRYGSLIDNVHVHPSATGRGIGSELLAIAFEALRRERPDAGVYLWVYEQNVAARRLYQRLGARLAETTVQSTPGGGAAPLCRYAWSTPAAFADAREHEVLAILDRQLRMPRTRGAVAATVAAVLMRAAAAAEPMLWQPVPADVFDQLPAGIRSSWVFFLRRATASGAERHSNSRQRMLSWQGGGDLQVGGDGHWRSHPMTSEPSAALEQRWISIAPCTWHQAVVPPGDDWVVVSFHTVDAGDLLEEKAGSVRRYLGA